MRMVLLSLIVLSLIIITPDIVKAQFNLGAADYGSGAACFNKCLSRGSLDSACRNRCGGVNAPVNNKVNNKNNIEPRYNNSNNRGAEPAFGIGTTNNQNYNNRSKKSKLFQKNDIKQGRIQQPQQYQQQYNGNNAVGDGGGFSNVDYKCFKMCRLNGDDYDECSAMCSR